MVPCVVLPYGLARLALRRTLWRKPTNRHDERLNLDCTYVLYAHGAYVRTCSRVTEWCGVVCMNGNGKNGRCHRLYLISLSTSPYLHLPCLAHVVWLGVMLATSYMSFGGTCGDCVIGDVWDLWTCDLSSMFLSNMRLL
jgi:hypothetical protein